jgi:WD40 repeat protein
VCSMKRGEGRADSIATGSEWCQAPGGDVGDVFDGVWLAAGYHDRIVRIWAVETTRCVATLHPMCDMHETVNGCVSVASDRSRVVRLIAPLPRNLGDCGVLHLWDIPSDGIQKRYAFVHGCKNKLGFELVSAVLLYQKSKRIMWSSAAVLLFGLSKVLVCSRK